MPVPVIEIRAEICDRCPTPCDKQRASEFHRDPCAECTLPHRQWGQYGECKQFGLGDLVASVAQPIARAIDAVAKTNIQGCGGCAQRRAALNKILPNINP